MNLYPFLLEESRVLHDCSLQLKPFVQMQVYSQADFVVEACDALVGPIFTKCGEDVTQGV